MRTTPFVDQVINKLSLFQPLARFMIGGYLLYADGVLVGQINEDVLYLKKFEENNYLADFCQSASPYIGAKPCYVVDTSDDELLIRAVQATVLGVKRSKK